MYVCVGGVQHQNRTASKTKVGCDIAVCCGQNEAQQEELKSEENCRKCDMKDNVNI